MKAVLPGNPEPRQQALSTGFWESRRVIVYITGNAIAVLGDHKTLYQTIYDDEPASLEAVAFDEATGSIAASTRDFVRVYRPAKQPEGGLCWALHYSFSLRVQHSSPDQKRQGFSTTLSWGASNELLVGNESLVLYRIGSTPSCSWRKTLANPIRWAHLSYDSAYIASAGYTERLVKIWRRLNFDSDNVRFDFSYLPHPAPVTGLQWRKPYHVGHTIDYVLYTFCADKILRIWTKPDGYNNAQQQLHLWGAVDLEASMQSATLGNSVIPKKAQLAFIIQGRDLCAATENAIQGSNEQSDDDVCELHHLVSLVNRSSDICFVLDAHGALTALSLENLDSHNQTTNDVNKLAQIVSPDFDFSNGIDGYLTKQEDHVEISTFFDKTGGHLHLLIHHFSGRIEYYEADIVRLLDEMTAEPRLWQKTTWAGQSGPIQKIVRNFGGDAIVSRTDEGESVIWRHNYNNKSMPLFPQNLLRESGPIHRICVLKKGQFVVLLFKHNIAVWDCRFSIPVLLGRRSYDISGTPLCLLVLPHEKAEAASVAHVATITSEKQGLVWKIVLPTSEFAADSSNLAPFLKVTAPSEIHGHGAPTYLSEFSRFELGDAGDLAYMLPVDPAGSNPSISGFLDVFARDVAISYTASGRVEFWTARIDHGRGRAEWLSTSAMETGISKPALVSGSTRKKAALVNSRRSAVTIWDIRGAQLEYEGGFESHDMVQDLDWTCTPGSQSILAIGFPHHVLLLSQLRFDYLNKGPAWAAVRQISIGELTPHPIGDSTWLDDGDLVVGAGNQLLLFSRFYKVSNSLISSLRLPQTKERTWDLFDVVDRLNGPLPVFHPQFLSQCMLAGKNSLIQRILLALHTTLKFWVPGETIDDYLGMDLQDFYDENWEHDMRLGKGQPKSFFARRESTDEGETFSEETAQAINEKLTSMALPQLSGHEQIQLVDIIECVGLVEKQRRSMDENAARYMLLFRQHALRKGRTNEIHMSWREINWAYHSTSQEILVDFVSKQHHSLMAWNDARESGMFMWLADNTAMKAQFEIIARNEYTKSEMKNPVDCSLFYLALKKKTVLQGLWRMASWNREQVPTQRLLSNNFEDPKWKTVALKNAYALMSKRRFEYAAAFFLLADHLQDAVYVCLNQLKDLQLAITIARVYEGDHGPVLRKVLEDEVLSLAAREGNRWLASWAFWMLHRRDMAVRALITPVYALIETPYSPELKSKLFLTDDPALVVLYAQLRQKTLQTLRGASKITPRVEWELVLHSARLYDRMGCDLLGLDLVRNWEFLQPGATTAPGLGGDINSLNMLRRRSSLVVADLPVSSLLEKMPADLKTGGRAQMTSTVFEEPDADSLLDSFGL